MFEELLESLVPGGLWLAAGVAVGAAAGSRIRPVAKVAIGFGMDAAGRAQAFGAEAVERVQDIVAEARHEHEQERAATPPARAPRRAQPRPPAPSPAPEG